MVAPSLASMTVSLQRDHSSARARQLPLARAKLAGLEMMRGSEKRGARLAQALGFRVVPGARGVVLDEEVGRFSNDHEAHAVAWRYTSGPTQRSRPISPRLPIPCCCSPPHRYSFRSCLSLGLYPRLIGNGGRVLRTVCVCTAASWLHATCLALVVKMRSGKIKVRDEIFFPPVLSLSFCSSFLPHGKVLLRAHYDSLHAWYLQLLTDPPAVPFHLSLSFSRLLPSSSPQRVLLLHSIVLKLLCLERKRNHHVRSKGTTNDCSTGTGARSRTIPPPIFNGDIQPRCHEEEI